MFRKRLILPDHLIRYSFPLITNPSNWILIIRTLIMVKSSILFILSLLNYMMRETTTLEQKKERQNP
jgi:hypothetical protein